MKHLLILDAPGTPYFAEYAAGAGKVEAFSAVRYAKGSERATESDLRGAEVVIVCHGNRLGREHISKLENCRGIVVATAGFDHIDLDAAEERGIPVSNIPDYGSEDVADHAMLLLLACVRRLPAMLTDTDAGNWDWSAAHGASRLRGRTLGIVGLGRIGRAMAERALAFGMRVAYYDPYVTCQDRADLEKVENLHPFLARCDVLSIHCPLTQETCMMIDDEALRRLRPGSILINTARGGVVDQQGIINHLQTGQLSSVGLDVLANEPRVPDELRNNDRAILTPHAAFYTAEGLQRMRDLALQAARNFAENRADSNTIVGNAAGPRLMATVIPRRFVANPAIIEDILRYAKRVARRNLVCNTFGSIAVLDTDDATGRPVVYTKHMGISLEEMGPENIVVLDLETDRLLHGTVRPSIGHQMNREIFRCRPDIRAVIHLHPDEVISYFSILHGERDRYISNDTALVMQGPVEVLAPDVNIELDLAPLRPIVRKTNCIVMPQHGITTLGETVSEAYHRACSIVAESRRLLFARILAANTGQTMPFVSDDSIRHMQDIGRKAIYGSSGPNQFQAPVTNARKANSC